jgi:hypothetical protein
MIQQNQQNLKWLMLKTDEHAIFAQLGSASINLKEAEAHHL